MSLPNIPIFVFDVLDSTSSEVQRQLRSGVAAPFAVNALTQQQGRGQMGRTWQSPAGHLYVSLAVPPSWMMSDEWPWSSLKAGVLVARWLEERFHLSIDLKWPNDLIAGGKKLGGILCEATSLGGHEMQSLVIGIGINVAPIENFAAAETEPTSLMQEKCVSESLDMQALAADFTGFILNSWQQVTPAAVQEEFRNRDCGVVGQWSKAEEEPARGVGLSSDGSYALQQGEKRLVLVSGSHGWRWQAPAKALYLLADVGNSRTKICMVQHGESDESVLQYENTLPPDIKKDLLREWLYQSVEMMPQAPLYILSVRPQESDTLQKIATGLHVPVQVMSKKRRRSWTKEMGYPLAQLGIDRLAAVEGWLAAPQKKDSIHASVALIVCAGTALTLDVVREDGEHLGGYIIPGLKTSLNVLHEKAQLLPSVDVQEEEHSFPSLGQNTKDAMEQGVITALVAFVEKIKKHVEEATEEVSKIVLTGGDAAVLKKYLPEAVVAEHLVLKGAQVLL